MLIKRYRLLVGGELVNVSSYDRQYEFVVDDEYPVWEVKTLEEVESALAFSRDPGWSSYKTPHWGPYLIRRDFSPIMMTSEMTQIGVSTVFNFIRRRSITNVVQLGAVHASRYSKAKLTDESAEYWGINLVGPHEEMVGKEIFIEGTVGKQYVYCVTKMPPRYPYKDGMSTHLMICGRSLKC